jgi:hypothetical protein
MGIYQLCASPNINSKGDHYMGSIRTIENIAKLVKTSVTTLSLPASRINIGAMQYVTSALTLNTAVVYPTLGGMDVAVAAGSLYYVYAVVSSNTVYLIASLNSSLPAGFTAARAVGGFTTNASSQIDQVGEYPGNLAVAGSVSAGGGLTAQPTQNFLINSAFDFSQRYGNASISNIGPNKYTLDRWWVNSDDANVYVQRVAVTDLPGFRYALKIARTASTGAVGRVQQPLEYANVLALQGNAVTLSFYYKTTGTALTSPYPAIMFDTATADMKEPTSIITNLPGYTPTTTWQRYSATFSVPVATKSMNVSLVRSASTGISDALYTGVMLNIGTQAAPFQRAGGTIGAELQLCQRYYEKSYSLGTAPGTTAVYTGIFVYQHFNTSLTHDWRMPGPSFKVPKRIVVTPTIYSFNGAEGECTSTDGGEADYGAASAQVIPAGDNTFGWRQFSGTTATLGSSQKVMWHWAADAEL